ncbi:MAG: hypothetical protein GY805_22020, partial [Chloroflexi bacterium]|nr:hypothetical protein [Chloroflexota bacterium]
MFLLFYDPGLSPDAIAFVYEHNGVAGIYAVSPDGSNRTPLVSSDLAHSWAADAWRDTSFTRKDLLASAIGNETPHTPAWISFGSQIAYMSRVHGRYCDELVLMDAQERQPHSIACLSRGYSDESIDWSPDGQYAAVATREENASALKLIDAAGVLTHHFPLNGSVWGIAWSPDATRIAAAVDDASSLHIYYLDHTVHTFQPEAAAFGKPSWSPDGQTIAFLCVLAGQIDICTMNADGTDYEQFSFPRPFPYLKSDLHWSPDGENIVFEVVQPSSGFNDLFLINADGSNPRQLTFHPASDSEPVWSPDGSQIAFVSMRDGNWEIYTINADGSE